MDLATTLGAAWSASSTGLSASASTAGKAEAGDVTVSSGAQSVQAASGDTVTISAEGRSLADSLASASNADTSISGSFSGQNGAVSMTGSASAGDSKTAGEVTAAAEQKGEETIAKRIEKLQQEIREAQQDPNLTDKEREEKVQRLQSELMQLQAQRQKSASKSGGSDALAYHGGTRAKGMASSLT